MRIYVFIGNGFGRIESSGQVIRIKEIFTHNGLCVSLSDSVRLVTVDEKYLYT